MDPIFHPIWCCWVCSYSGIQVWHMQAIINTKQQQQKTAAEEAAAAICLLPLRAAFWNIQKYIQQLKHLIKSSLSSNEYAPALKSYWENSFESIFSRKLLIFPLSWNKFALAHWRAMDCWKLFAVPDLPINYNYSNSLSDVYRFWIEFFQ